jgi:rhamnosyl/mannosyltransferase
MEPELRAQAARLQLDNVTFAGHVPDDVKVALLRLSRGVVLPSHLRSEAFGVTLLEGAMHARPLISAEVGSGTSYVNEDGRTGFVVEPESPGALREAMDRLYANLALAEDMGIGARARYERLFTGRQMGERYLQIYRDLLGRAPSEHP